MTTSPNADNDDEEESYWYKVQREAPVKAIEKCEEAAKQLITLNTLLLTLLWGIVSFNQAFINAFAGSTMLILGVPVIFSLLSLILATQVFIPRIYNTRSPNIIDASGQSANKVETETSTYDQSDTIAAQFSKISRKKLEWLLWSYRALIACMISIPLIIMIYYIRVGSFTPCP